MGAAGEAMRDEHALLEVRGLVCGYGKKEIVHGVDMTVRAGEFVCVIGANGCGKSTLLKNVLGLDAPFAGEVLVNGQPTAGMSDSERAQRFAYLPQEHTPPFPFTVADVVLMGRTPHMDRWAHIDDADREVAWEALRLLGIEELAAQVYTELSGGQRQLVLIARCLAQQPELIVMDEPTASLDFGNQQVVLSRMRALTRGGMGAAGMGDASMGAAGSADCVTDANCKRVADVNRKRGMGVVMVTHDPHHAFLCADRVYVMQAGKMVAMGSPAEVMTAQRLFDVYGTRVDVLDVKLSNGGDATVCVPLWDEQSLA